MKISAKLSQATAEKFGLSVTPVEVECDIPASLADKVTKFGEDVVNSSSEDALIITVQALMRRMMVPKVNKEGKVTAPVATPAEIQAAVDAWKPDVKTLVRQSASERAMAAVTKMTPEERAELLKKLQAL
jgi:hypothetical protein